jgi:alpha-L-rhamnosidase
MAKQIRHTLDCWVNAAPANIISRKLMGIEPLAPGWAKFRIRPQIGGLKYADITVPTVKGPVKVSYKQERSCFKADVAIPANTSAQFFLPLNGRKNYQVLLNGKNVKATSVNGAAVIGHLGSGIHRVRMLYLN